MMQDRNASYDAASRCMQEEEHGSTGAFQRRLHHGRKVLPNPARPASYSEGTAPDEQHHHIRTVSVGQGPRVPPQNAPAPHQADGTFINTATTAESESLLLEQLKLRVMTRVALERFAKDHEPSYQDKQRRPTLDKGTKRGLELSFLPDALDHQQDQDIQKKKIRRVHRLPIRRNESTGRDRELSEATGSLKVNTAHDQPGTVGKERETNKMSRLESRRLEEQNAQLILQLVAERNALSVSTKRLPYQTDRNWLPRDHPLYTTTGWDWNKPLVNEALLKQISLDRSLQFISPQGLSRDWQVSRRLGRLYEPDEDSKEDDYLARNRLREIRSPVNPQANDIHMSARQCCAPTKFSQTFLSHRSFPSEPAVAELTTPKRVSIDKVTPSPEFFQQKKGDHSCISDSLKKEMDALLVSLDSKTPQSFTRTEFFPNYRLEDAIPPIRANLQGRNLCPPPRATAFALAVPRQPQSHQVKRQSILSVETTHPPENDAKEYNACPPPRKKSTTHKSRKSGAYRKFAESRELQQRFSNRKDAFDAIGRHYETCRFQRAGTQTASGEFVVYWRVRCGIKGCPVEARVLESRAIGPDGKPSYYCCEASTAPNSYRADHSNAKSHYNGLDPDLKRAVQIYLEMNGDLYVSTRQLHAALWENGNLYGIECHDERLGQKGDDRYRSFSKKARNLLGRLQKEQREQQMAEC